MRRREFAMGTGILLGTARAGEAAESDDVAAVKKTIEDVYRIFYVDLDKRRYRALLADDYLLLEHGELLDIDGDMALMPAPDSGFKRTDTFDFRSVKIQGDLAYAVYYLKAAMTDKSGPRERQWLESAILRRSGGRWLMALLHSTRITKSGA
jgi:ketosteroid isomerase-like protein